MDTIFIENLVYAGTHGVHPEEQTTAQRFSVDVTIDLETYPASETDKLQDTFDYQDTKNLVRSIIEGEHCHLIERIGHRIANRILEDTRVHACTVSIKKLDLWGNGTPGIVIERVRQNIPEQNFLLNVPALLREVGEKGAYAIPLLNPELCQKMKTEAERFQFRAAEKEYGKNRVRQRFNYFRRYPPESLLWKVGRMLEQKINEETIRSSEPMFQFPLHFNEVSAQRYTPGELGISPHRDEKRYKNIIAICIVEGDAEFYTTTDRVGGIETLVLVKPGDVIFMKSPGFKNCDLCPLHAVRNITSPRLSITYRHDTFLDPSTLANK